MHRRELLWPMNQRVVRCAGRQVKEVGLRRTCRFIPAAGLRLWGLSPRDAAETVRLGLRAGFRVFDVDTADAQEAAVGAELAAWHKGDLRRREELFVSVRAAAWAPEAVRAAFDAAGRALRIGYADAATLTWPLDVGAFAAEAPAAAPAAAPDLRTLRAAWEAVRALRPPHAQLAQNAGLAHLTPGSLGFLFRDMGHDAADLLSLEYRLDFQQPELLAAARGVDVVCLCLVARGEPSRAAALACAEMGITEEALAARLVASEGHVALVAAEPDEAALAKLHADLTATPGAPGSHLAKAEVELLRSLEQNNRRVGAEYPFLWRTVRGF